MGVCRPRGKGGGEIGRGLGAKEIGGSLKRGVGGKLGVCGQPLGKKGGNGVLRG